jgi:UDP-N-acetylglucosamine:LPS N-acetylglucosamine transferase
MYGLNAIRGKKMQDVKISKNNKKICLAASAGGHLTQLLKITDSWTDCEAVYISTSQVVASKLSQFGKTYIVGECNRKHFIECVKVLFRCLAIAVKERPDYVLSTGAAPGFFLCITAKLLGAKVIWVDSIANVKKLSMSGKLIRPFADLFLTQWPELQNNLKGIEYQGGVI